MNLNIGSARTRMYVVQVCTHRISYGNNMRLVFLCMYVLFTLAISRKSNKKCILSGMIMTAVVVIVAITASFFDDH